MEERTVEQVRQLATLKEELIRLYTEEITYADRHYRMPPKSHEDKIHTITTQISDLVNARSLYRITHHCWYTAWRKFVQS